MPFQRNCQTYLYKNCRGIPKRITDNISKGFIWVNLRKKSKKFLKKEVSEEMLKALVRYFAGGVAEDIPKEINVKKIQIKTVRSKELPIEMSN